MTEERRGWIGVDLDGTLAKYEYWSGVEHVGEPIPAMVVRVKQWLADGEEVKIFTARMSAMPRDGTSLEKVRTMIEDWCEEHIGQRLEVTHEKHYSMKQLWDDRAVRVINNTGETCCDVPGHSVQWRLDEATRALSELDSVELETMISMCTPGSDFHDILTWMQKKIREGLTLAAVGYKINLDKRNGLG